jgi:stalled ribosome rescue protein Dom34
MRTDHVVVWIDQAEAHIIHVDRVGTRNEVLKVHATKRHLHVRSGRSGSDHARENQAYFDEIAEALSGRDTILIVGPGFEKLALMKHLARCHPDVAERVVSVETVDHPSDGQLFNFARKYFVKADQFV